MKSIRVRNEEIRNIIEAEETILISIEKNIWTRTKDGRGKDTQRL